MVKSDSVFSTGISTMAARPSESSMSRFTFRFARSSRRRAYESWKDPVGGKTSP